MIFSNIAKKNYAKSFTVITSKNRYKKSDMFNRLPSLSPCVLNFAVSPPSPPVYR